MLTIYTIGHSTRSIEEFVGLLQDFKVTQLVDIRTVPGSRHNPQYGQQALEASLHEHGIGYMYMKNLGGLRRSSGSSINHAWRNKSFRNYADYMQTEEFRLAVDELIVCAKKSPTAIMCAEAVPWRCHRSLVGDALLVRKVRVRDIMAPGKDTAHTLTSFALVHGDHITYPAETA